MAPDVNSVRIKASGKGFALLEVGYRYNINTPEAVSAFSLKPKVNLLSDEHVTVEIDTSYNPPKGKDSSKNSNMAILEAELPSGFVVNSEVLNGLKSTLPTLKRIETKNADTVAVFYFDYLSAEPITFKIDGFREHIVENQKPASILVYDYYDNGKILIFF